MKTLDAFDRQFPTEEACREYLVQKRWPNGVSCPRCAATERVYKLRKPFTWLCKNAECGGRNGYRFSVLTCTIFQDTKIPLKTWFRVGYLMLTAKKGISALQVHRVIFGEDSGSDYRTSWYMCHRWRAAMQGAAFPLDGIVEVDETYVGGSDRNRHKGKKSSDVRKKTQTSEYRKPGESVGYLKTGVIGAISRKGNVVAAVIGGMDAPTKQEFVRRVVSKNVKLLVTDSDHAFRYVDQGMPHEAVNHGKGEYVRGIVHTHTNTIESFWSLVKRGVMGSFHNVSKDYLPLYLNEFSFRFNHRKHPDAFGAVMATCSQ
jgi:hypothetical protein